MAVLGTVASVLTLAGPATAALRSSCDFDSDGRSDLTIAAMNEELPDATKGGMVAVIDGHPQFGPTRVTRWTQGNAGGGDTPEHYDGFGVAVTCGDFDGDAYDDLAVGAANETVGDAPATGQVTVIYGSGSGLRANRAQTFDEDSPGLGDETEVADRFGSALASGDFNGDGRDDLVISVFGESYDGAERAGAVHVLYGSGGGLRSEGATYLRKDTFGERPRGDDWFGYAVAAGDLDGDGDDDLIIGVPGDDVLYEPDDAGSIHVVLGSPQGITTAGNQFWWSGSDGLVGRESFGALFGLSLATGDFNRDGRADVAVGAPLADATPQRYNTGYVHLIYGASAGLTTTKDRIIHQDTRKVGDVREADDQFGRGLAAGDFDNDGYDDLAVGAPFEGVGRSRQAGAVTVLYGREGAIRGVRSQRWTQTNARTGDRSEKTDLFGISLATGDWNGDGAADLAAGAPFEDIEGAADAGRVLVLFGLSGGRLIRAGALNIDENMIGATRRASEYFGSFDLAPTVYGF